MTEEMPQPRTRLPARCDTLSDVTRRRKSLPVWLLSLAATGALSGCHTSDFPTFPDGFREFAYIANSGANTVTVLDLVNVRVDRTLRVGANPIDVIANPRKAEVYVLSRETGSPAGSVAVIDTSRNEVAVTLPVRQDPVGFSVDPTGVRAFVANAGSNSISILDLDTRRALAAIPTAAPAPAPPSSHPTAAPSSSRIPPRARSRFTPPEPPALPSLYSPCATPTPAAAAPPAPSSCPIPQRPSSRARLPARCFRSRSQPLPTPGPHGTIPLSPQTTSSPCSTSANPPNT